MLMVMLLSPAVPLDGSVLSISGAAGAALRNWRLAWL
jgi:hypothetical protein